MKGFLGKNGIYIFKAKHNGLRIAAFLLSAYCIFSIFAPELKNLQDERIEYQDQQPC